MLGGMILYGGIGWLVSHFTGIAILFPLGMILGIGLSVALIIFRFTRILTGHAATDRHRYSGRPACECARHVAP